MTCTEILQLLPECVEDALAKVRRKDVEAHLSACASCSAALAEARKLDPFLRRALPVAEPPAGYWAQQEARALKAATRPAATAPSQSRGGSRRYWVMGIAAALLVAVGLFVLIRPAPTPPPPDRESAKEPAAVLPSGDPPRPLPFRAPRVPEPEARPVPNGPPLTLPPGPNAPVPEPAGTTTAILPGHADYLDRLSDESVEVGLAETVSDRVLGLIKAADGRMNELRAAISVRNEAMAEDLAAAYTLIYRQGIAAVLSDRGADAQDLATARVVARTYAGWKVDALAKLEPEARGNLKSALQDALLATREIAGQ